MIPGAVDNYAGDGRFLQIKSQEDHRPLLFLDIWTCIIQAQSSAKLLTYLKENLPEEPHNLAHIRRLMKLENFDYEKYKLSIANGKGGEYEDDNANGDIHVKRPHITYLRVCICTTDCIQSEEEVTSIVHKALSPEIIIEKRKCSKYQAYTKEQAAEWSIKSGWPIMFRGNPNAIRTELNDKEVESMKINIKALVELSKKHKSDELPIATLIVDPETDKAIVSNLDSRKEIGNPINHSIMMSLYEAAVIETERRKQIAAERSSRSSTAMPEDNNEALPVSQQLPASLPSSLPPSLSTSSSVSLSSHDSQFLSPEDKNYLCLNLHIYTTHEPCPMCAMALVHSRIGRLIYIKSCPATGAIEPNSGASYSVHWNKLLNWKYEAWKWNSEGYEKTEDDEFISSVEDIPLNTNA